LKKIFYFAGLNTIKNSSTGFSYSKAKGL